MSKLDELIQKLCPNGVEWKELGEVCVIETGKQLNRSKLFDDGIYPVMNGGREASGYWNQYNYEGENLIISQGGASAGFVNYLRESFWAGAHCYVVINLNVNLNKRYLYHYLKMIEIFMMNSQQGAGIPSLTKKTFYSFRIPFPPLEIQKEIVHILDSFTELTENLTKELTTRRKQYEFYRDSLLTFGDDVKWKELGEVCKLIMGTSPSGNTISERETNFGIEFHQGKTFFGDSLLKHSHLYTTNPIKVAEPESILMSVRAPVGDVNITNRRVAIGRGLCSMIGKNGLNTKFLYYFINANKRQFKRKSNGSTFESINTNDIKSIKIPLPSLSEQERIVSILDKFDNLCNDITQGLPAEIEARKKQYEYYRDKLLDFKDISDFKSS